MLADIMLTESEGALEKVFSRIGKSETSLQTDRLVAYIQRRKSVPYQEAYRMIHSHFPDFKEFESILSGVIRAGYVKLEQKGVDFWLTFVK